MALTKVTDKVIGNTDGNLNLSGIVTATTFSGSFTGNGQNLTGLPAGLGTALSSDQSNVLNKFYYTNSVISIASTTTIDPPATASAAYTQYAEVRCEESADLIIEDNDDLVIDVLDLFVP
tara:strand:- start:1607 stop:1966 length:360 start_codon:yes stop_codon:yes gene_type:complete